MIYFIALLWCDDHEDDEIIKVTQEMNDVVLAEKLPEESQYSGWLHSSQSRASMTAGLVHQLALDPE